MAKSMRCKRVKRLRAIRRDMVEPYYDKKDQAKLAAQEAALAAPKLPVRLSRKEEAAMEIAAASAEAEAATNSNMDVEMADGSQTKSSLKPVGGIGKKHVFKVGKKRRGKGKGKGMKVKKRHI